MTSVDLEHLTPEPWQVRTYEHDSWGVLRGPPEPDFPFGKFLGELGTPIAKSDFYKTVVFGSPEWERGPLDVAANVEFIALARRAFGVMMRRGWVPQRARDGNWFVRNNSGETFSGVGHAVPRQPDPFTALVEADKWMTEQEGNAHE